MLFKRYKIATRLTIGVSVILFLMLVLVGVEIRGMNNVRDTMNEIVGKHYERLQVAKEMRFLARHCGVVVRNMLLVTDEESRHQEYLRFGEAESEYYRLFNKLAGLERSEEEERSFQRVAESGEVTFALWGAIAENIDVAAEAGSRTAMEILEAEVRNNQWGWLDGLEELVSIEKRLAEQAMNRFLDNYNTIKIVMAVVNILAFTAGLSMVVVIAAGIVGPLREITRRVDHIASGDLSTRINLDQEDEVGNLATHIDRMAEKLQANEEELNEYRYNLEELIELRTGEVNDQRERFISVLIHDLKGPLIPVIGLSRLLAGKKNLTRRQVGEYARAIHDSAGKLVYVVEQTSQNLRDKRTSYSFDKEPFDIEDLLCAVCKNCQVGAAENHVQLTLNGTPVEECKSSHQYYYSGDIGKIRSLFENLISNAGKYAVSAVDIAIRRNHDQIEFIIDDDGSGVKEPFRKKIFEEYYQAPNSLEGTGVGLYSVKRIVDHYQGRITVASSPSGGARFMVFLPMTDHGVMA